MSIKRGEIHVVALDPVIGSEIAKTRPAVVISNDKNNQFSATVTVLPVTSQHHGKVYPCEDFLPKGVGNLPKNSKVKADQIRTVDKRRLVGRVGNLGPEEIARVEAAMKVHLKLFIKPFVFKV